MSVKISFSFATYVKRLFYGHMFSVLLPEKLGNLDLQCRKKNIQGKTQCINSVENQSSRLDGVSVISMKIRAANTILVFRLYSR